MRRIAIVGSFSTGKTTLARAAAKRLDLPVIPEAASQALLAGWSLDAHAPVTAEIFMFLRQLNNEERRSEFVADRCLIDIMAHGPRSDEEIVSAEQRSLWRECMQLGRSTIPSRYSHVFYLPVELPIVWDGVRPPDAGYRAAIDERICEIMGELQVPFRVLRGTLEERLAALSARVGR